MLQLLRRAKAVALFDRDACREILYDPLAIYQGLAVLVAGVAATILLEFLDPRGDVGALSTSGAEVASSADAASVLLQAAVGVGVWAAGIVVIMVFGRYVMASGAVPSWRSFSSLWCFTDAPWVVVSLVAAGLSAVRFDEELGGVIMWASLAVLLAGILWGIAVQVHAVRYAFDSESTVRASILVVAVWALQSASGYVLW